MAGSRCCELDVWPHRDVSTDLRDDVGQTQPQHSAHPPALVRDRPGARLNGIVKPKGPKSHFFCTPFYYMNVPASAARRANWHYFEPDRHMRLTPSTSLFIIPHGVHVFDRSND